MTEPTTIDRQALQKSGGTAAKQNVNRAVNRVNTPALVGLSDIVKERGSQQVWIVVARLDKQVIDAEVVGAIERRQSRQELPLRIAGQQPLQFSIDGWIVAAADDMPELPHAPDRAMKLAAPKSRCWRHDRCWHQNNDDPTMVETRKS